MATCRVYNINPCIICNKENAVEQNTPAFKRRNNSQLCRRFILLVSRYLNSNLTLASNFNSCNDNNANDFKPEKTLCTKVIHFIDGNKKNEKDSVAETDFDSPHCCESCFPVLKSFCRIYNAWQYLQLKLNSDLQRLTEIIQQSSTKDDAIENEAEFRFKLVQSIDKKRKENFPRVEVTRCQTATLASLLSKSRLKIKDKPVADNELKRPEPENDNATLKPKSKKKKSAYKPKFKHIMMKCSYCDQKFSKLYKRQTLILHEAAHRGDNPEYKCEKCGEILQSFRELLRHESLHEPGQKFKCTFCDKIFTRPNRRKEHENNVHLLLKKKKWKCGQCDKFFKTRFDCKRHEDSIHVEEKAFKCRFCEHRCSYGYMIQRHERIHTKEFYSKCKFCPKTFSVDHNRIRHERLHTESSEFICKFCGEKFTRKFNMLKHERRHLGEKPYKCDLCDQRFTQSYGRRLHMQKMHNLKGNSSDKSKSKIKNANMKRIKDKKKVKMEKDCLERVIKTETVKFEVDVKNLKTEKIYDLGDEVEVKMNSESETLDPLFEVSDVHAVDVKQEINSCLLEDDSLYDGGT